MTNQFDFSAEFQATPETAQTHELKGNGEGTADAAERQVYVLKDGSEGSRAAYIRELFLDNNLSRKEIADQTGFAYRVVYSATVNMTNDSEPTGRGRSITNPMIKVYGEDQLLVDQDDQGNYTVVATGEGVNAEDVTECSRNEWIKEQVDKGISRGDVAKQLELSYGVIYNLTKEQDGVRVKHDIELEDGTTMSRAAYIRQEFGAGKSRSDIARELDVPYSVVWQATKTEKSDADKFADLVEQVKGYADKVIDKGDFEAILEALALVEIKMSDDDEANAAAAEAAEA